MKIKLEQAVFGEKDRGHSLLKHSFESSKTPNQISLKTDLPSGHTSFPSYNFYCSAISTSEYYVLIKSFPDSSAQRSGFVYSYSLFIKNYDLEHVNDLSNLFDLLPNEINKEYLVTSIEIESENGVTNKSGNLDKAKKVAYGLLNSKMPIVWLGQEKFVETISIVWNNLSPILKSKFQFRVSFGPKDIEQTNEQIVYSPVGLKGKWEKYFVINEQDLFVEEYSDDIKYLIEIVSKNNPIKNYILELEINISSFFDIKKVVLLNKFLNDDSFDNLLNSIELLAQLLPSKESGKKLKKEIIEKTNSKLKRGDINNILAFRNVEIKHIEEITSIKKGIKIILQNWNFETEVEQLFISVINKDVQKWWKDVIDNGLMECFNDWSEKHSKMFWNLITKDISKLDLIKNYIPNDEKVEQNIAQHFPQKLNDKLGFELINLSIKKKWYLLHASVVVKIFLLSEALALQLKIDTVKTYTKGLEFICNNFPSDSFIKQVVENPERRLIKLSAKLTSENPLLINSLDVNNLTWLEIWNSRYTTVDVFKGFKSPKKTLFSLLESLIFGNDIPEELLLLISQSRYSDISDYKNRNKIWNYFKGETLSNFLKSTAQECLNKKLLDLSSITLEIELIKEIENKNLFISVPNKENLSENIIQLFIDFDEFSENSLIAFLDVIKRSLNKSSCLKLGKLLSIRKWVKTYQKVKIEYSKYNSYFKDTLSLSKDNFPEVEQSFLGKIFNKTKPETNVKKIFISYSRKDVDFKNDLLIHLKPLERSSLVNAWDCSKIRAGEWDKQIKEELDEADIMIFMVSASFMASDYIVDNEVQKGIELAKNDPSKKIMCVLVRECTWNQWPILDESFKGDGSSDLSRFQFLPYYNANGAEAILALEDWGKGGYMSINNAYKQIVEKLMIELRS
ncbi:TIR domain-containing protein [Dokdonia sp.]|uniref:GAP1-N1 domain-containing protein n=1 Tax=Dokdonia sp. TaxID=2024995 RepID=UPI0032673761